MQTDDAVWKALEKAGVKRPAKLNPKKMTDEELARLRFMTVSEEEAKEILKEIDKRQANHDKQ